MLLGIDCSKKGENYLGTAMKKINLFLSLLLLTPCIALASKKVLLKTPIAFNTNLPGLGTTIKYVKDRVEAASENTIKIKLYEPGKLVPPFEILDAVSTGKVDAGYAVSGYWQGKMIAAPLFSSVPFGPEVGEYLAWLKFGNGEKLYQELLDAGVEVILDDRNVRPGVMFNDMELIGIPHRVVIGERGLDQGVLEYRKRTDTENGEIPLDGALQAILEHLA